MSDPFPTFHALGKALRDPSSSFRERSGAAARRTGAVLGKLGRGALVLLVVGFVAHSMLLVVWGIGTERQLAQLLSTGAPTKPADLVSKPVPDDLNAATYYLKAFALPSFGGPPRFSADEAQPPRDPKLASRDNNAISKLVDEKSTPEERRAAIPDVRAALDHRSGAFPLFRKAASLSECRFPVRWQDGANVMLPHLKFMRDAEETVTARAVLRSMDGDTNGSVDDIILGLRVSRSLEKEPMLIGQLVRFSLAGTAVSGLKRVSDTTALNPAQARRVYDCLSTVSFADGFKRGLEGERALGMGIFDQLRGDPGLLADATSSGKTMGRVKRALFAGGGYVWRPLFYKDQQISLRIWDRIIPALDRPYREGRGKSLDRLILRAPKYAVVTRFMLPVYSGAVASRDTAQANVDLARTAMALSAYRSRFGSYPSSLPELEARLGWEIPNDIFSGKPFVYKRQGDSYELYSIGANLKDDGGVPPKPNQNRYEAGDVVWR